MTPLFFFVEAALMLGMGFLNLGNTSKVADSSSPLTEGTCRASHLFCKCMWEAGGNAACYPVT